jgi:carboxyl-terminal processing protease
LIVKKNQRALTRLALIILTLSLLFSSLTSCTTFTYVAGSKAELTTNVEESEENKFYVYVSDYLRDWGVPLFDGIKFKYMEGIVQILYNYGDGLPGCHTHAKTTATLFIENYYDKIDLSNKTTVTDALLSCYTAAIGDPYTIYRPPVETDAFNTNMSGKFGGIGVLAEYNHNDESIIISKVFPESPAEKAGVLPGDIIHAVDGKTVDELGYLNAVDYVRGEIGSTVDLTLIRNGNYVTLSIKRAEIDEINVTYEIDEDKIGYVQIAQFKDNTYDQFVEAIEYLEENGAVGIVFDLRGNPGGYLRSVTNVVSYLVPNGNTVVSYQYKGQANTVYTTKNDNKDGDHVVDLPFVVICNERTASAGEIFTAALRDYDEMELLNATIVGTKTYAKGIMQNTYYYFDQSSITMTVAYYCPPSGVNYHGTGIIPDVVVENADNNVDLQLEAAYLEMHKLLNAN